MIILNKPHAISRNGVPNNSKVSIVDLKEHSSTNNYYETIWKNKYNVSIYNNNTTTNFEKNLIKYLKGEKPFIE
jgi:hypothetical protein